MDGEGNGRPDETDGQRTDGIWARLPAIALMVFVLFAAGALSAVTAMRLAIQGREVQVPDLSGLEESEAERSLVAAGLEMEVDSRRFSPVVPRGVVLDQRPLAGSRVKQDRRVRVRVSLGDREFAVPEIRGASLRSAQLQLVERGLTAGNTLYAHTPDGDPGTVLFQDPAPGETESDPAVNVLVSLGPADQYYVMPVLTGRTIGEARRLVREAGFRLREETYPGAGSLRSGRVVTQAPGAGTRVSSNDTITLGTSP